MLENREKFKELGLDKFLPNPNPPAVKINKEKDKVQEESDEYILENESEEEDSEDSSKVKLVSSLLWLKLIGLFHHYYCCIYSLSILQFVLILLSLVSEEKENSTWPQDPFPSK